ncbi:MAG: glycerol-3-phosphate dehydrogenase/oxidase [Bryobacterales bacterium]|nr:glycerol-3-phosphate dehydrogenase/oxidase [Bryobacterales bacterium]
MAKQTAERDGFDLAIVGGGIIGAGVARDASRRGLRTVLLEKNDFGAGTTSGSTRLIHGGLRYLEMLDFGLVRMDLRERETLLRIAPHLVKPLQFYLPYYDASWFYRAKMQIGLGLYDLLSYDKSLPNRGYLPAAEIASHEPALRRDGLSGASTYYDAQVNMPERLCMENVLDAARHGCVVRNGVEVTAAIHEEGRLAGIRVRNEAGEVEEIRARLICNTSGPWFDEVAARLQPEAPHRVRMTKGIHLAVEPLNREAWVLFSPVDRRLFFAIPWMGMSWLGTTDTDYRGDPADAAATPADVEYLLRSTEHYFPAVRKQALCFTNAGIRALVTRPGKESAVSRSHQLVDGERKGAPGLVSVVGGKITGYRAIAEETTDLIVKRLSEGIACDTASAPLPGAVRGDAVELCEREAVEAGIPRESARALLPFYGARLRELASLCREDPSLTACIHPDYPELRAQVRLAVEREYCRNLDDFLARRTTLAFSPDQGGKAVETVAALMGARLGWDADESRRQRARWEAYLGRTSPAPGA